MTIDSRPTSSSTMNLTKRDFSVVVMAIVFFVVMFGLQVLKHNAFNTRIHDFARFSQAMWSTLDGDILYTSLSGRTILGDHFSPIMAIFAPALWIWPNERVLFLLQTANVTATGLILYTLARSRFPAVAPVFALMFFLNPAVHELTLFEFRRIIFGMPWLALGLCGVVTKNRRLMLVGLLIALLAKESIALYVLMIGVYLILVERDWRWGIGLIALGGAWSYIVGDIIIGYFNQGVDLYPQLYYYDHLGASYGELIELGLTEPLRMLRIISGEAQLTAIFRILLPFAFLVLIEWPLLLIATPYLVLMFLSRDVDMFQLDKWYTTTLTPLLFVALIKMWGRLPRQMHKLALLSMLVGTAVSFFVYSYAPLGGRFDTSIYQSDPRDTTVNQMLDKIPADAAIKSHARYIPHLTEHHELYFYFPLVGGDNIDHILFDSKVAFYPFDSEEVIHEAANLVADPSLTVVEEVDGFYLFALNRPPLPSYPVGKSAEAAMMLDRFELAWQDDDHFYQTTAEQQPTLQQGDHLRISLYWNSLSDDIAERTISIRITGEDGRLITQHDQIPANGYRPTSTWDSTTAIRDVYYMTIPADTPPQAATLDIVLYDTFTNEQITFTGEESPVMRLLPLRITAATETGR